MLEKSEEMDFDGIMSGDYVGYVQISSPTNPKYLSPFSLCAD